METPVSEDALASMVEHLRTFLDDSIMPGDTMAQLKSRKKLQAFLDSHCQLRHYSFCIKKCGDSMGCPVCFEPQLPKEVFEQLHFLPDPIPKDDEHYKSFQVF